VIFFREQHLAPEQFLGFARRFGEVVEYPFIKGIDGFPEITRVLNLEHESVKFAGLWHTDAAYLECRPMGTMLLARKVPPFGGDTLFANMYLAYETFVRGMRRLLDGLVAVNSSAKADVTKTREDRLRDAAKADAHREYVAEHPVVRTHPETGRKALYVNGGHTVRFQAASGIHLPLPLGSRLDRLLGQSLRPAQPDQRLPRHRRVMHRVTLAGDQPH
jgi:taurine dioxygenase